MDRDMQIETVLVRFGGNSVSGELSSPWAVGCDADFGGHSTVAWSLAGSGAVLHGSLSLLAANSLKMGAWWLTKGTLECGPHRQCSPQMSACTAIWSFVQRATTSNGSSI